MSIPSFHAKNAMHSFTDPLSFQDGNKCKLLKTLLFAQRTMEDIVTPQKEIHLVAEDSSLTGRYIVDKKIVISEATKS